MLLVSGKGELSWVGFGPVQLSLGSSSISISIEKYSFLELRGGSSKEMGGGKS